MKYKTEYCEKCKCHIVICPNCKQSCHYGNKGRVKILSTKYYDEVNDEYIYNYEDCKECENAYAYQKEISPNLSNDYTKVYMNNIEIGSSNKNHVSFSKWNNE